MATAFLLAAALGEPGEQWNGPEGSPRCDSEVKYKIWDSWTNDFAANERAIYMQSESYICEGRDCSVDGAFSPMYGFMCATKGPGGAGSNVALDPVAHYTMSAMTSQFSSQKPCKFLDRLHPPLLEDRRLSEAASREASSGDVPESSSTAACIEPSFATCEYPEPPAGLTKVPHLPDKKLDRWPGLLLHLADLNGLPDLASESYAPDEVFSHRIPYGVDGWVCEDSTDYDRDYFAERAFYNGGVLVEKTRGPVTTRSYIFKSDADRELAKADDRNLGLKYAKTFTGESGCDTEVVWEIEPKAGGGLYLELQVPLDAKSCETEQGLRNAVATYYTGEELVVLVGKKALKEASYLNSTCGAGGYRELVRFAANFVCKSTGANVAATVTFMNDQGTQLQLSELSTDPSNPTPFYTGTGVNYFGSEGVCDGGSDWRPAGSRFTMTASAADAPESCGTLYWDPLLQAVPGDGFAWQLVDGVYVAVSPDDIDGLNGTISTSTDTNTDETENNPVPAIIGGTVGGLLALLVGGWVLYKRRASLCKYSKAPKGNIPQPQA